MASKSPSERKRIAVVTQGVKLGNETKGYDRFKYIADMLVEHGFSVDLITSSFQHWEKSQRNTQEPAYEAEAFNVVFIYEPGYSKNIDPARIASHRIAARNLEKHFATHEPYDLIYSEIPPNDMAFACAKTAEAWGVPFVADVNDLWPEAMRMVLDVPVLSDVMFFPLQRDAEATYRLCTAVVGTSDEYAARPLQKLPGHLRHITVYVGNDIAAFDAGITENRNAVEKPAGEFWVTYAGTIGTSYDIRTLIQAAMLLKQHGNDDVRVKILGNGPLKDELEAYARTAPCNVGFLGYTPFPLMAAHLAQSDVLVNSFVRKAPQSIVTKIGDYLAAAKPMINTCVSPEFRAKVAADGFGINIEPEDPVELAAAILELQAQPQLCETMGRKGRAVAESQFNRPVSYQKITALIDDLLSSGR